MSVTEKQREDLRDLARGDIPLPMAGVACCCGQCLHCRWAEYRHELALADGLDNQVWADPAGWRDINPELTCADPEGAARDEIWQRVGNLEDLLLGGNH